MEQGLTEFSDSVPSAHFCFTLAGWGLATGRMCVWNGTGAVLNSQRLRCWGSRVWIRPQPPPQLLTHQHLLMDSSCLASQKDKDLAKKLRVIYYVKIGFTFGPSNTSDETK